ncbi:MAG: LysR family transcriptional regulator [Gammaproteobacteria bacterium]|nr:LysR family transcriptional regulator [Gammaproteobacteria bacterium]
MEIQTLQAFLAVAKSNSFSKAALTLHLSQSAISKRIASLENELNCRLFDRIGRHINLTEAGNLLLPRAKKIIGEVEQCRQLMHNLHNTIGGTLSIGTSHHIGLHRLPTHLQTFTHRYPEVELDLHFLDSEEACQKVLSGALELAVVTLPQESNRRLTTHLLWQDPMLFMVNKTHPLSQKKNLKLKDLLPYPAILPSQGTYTRDLIDQALQPQNTPLKIALETHYLETIKSMVGIGLGWSVLPESLCNDDLFCLKLSDIQISRQLGYVQHRERTLSNAARAFINTLSTQKDPDHST